MANCLSTGNIISIADLTWQDIVTILDAAQSLKADPNPVLLRGKIIANCFFEPSTRTRLSFASAVYRLGGNVIGFASDASTSSGQKGESLHDAIKVIDSYADAIVLRHSQHGAAKLASEVAQGPIINAGDGGNQHPTQALLDLFTIRERQGQLHDLTIALVGDLKYGRTTHSLVQALAMFGAKLYFISPDELAMPESICASLTRQGVSFAHGDNIADIIKKVDVLYMTRMQKERFIAGETVTGMPHGVLTRDLVEQARPSLTILHPLPRVDEIARSVDNMPQAAYFQQAANGIPVRQALLYLLLQV